MIGKLALALVLLHGPQGVEIWINPASVTTFRTGPSAKGDLFSETVKCLLNTSDGKFISVIETCDEVRDLLKR